MFCVYWGVTISDKISSQYSRHEIVQCVGGKRTDTENQAALTIVRRLSWRQKNWSSLSLAKPSLISLWYWLADQVLLKEDVLTGHVQW